MSKSHGKHARVANENEELAQSPELSEADDTQDVEPADSADDATELLPAVSDVQAADSDDATELLPPVGNRHDTEAEGETEVLPPVSADEEDAAATVMLTPVETDQDPDSEDDTSAGEDADDDDAEQGDEEDAHDDAEQDDQDASGEQGDPMQDGQGKADAQGEPKKGAHAAGKHASNGAKHDKAEQGDEGMQAYAPAPLASGESAYVAASFGEIPLKKRRNGLKVFGITLGIIAAAVLLAYLVGAVIFMGRFLPSTVIGGKDISLKTDEEVVKMLDDIASDYRLSVFGGGFSYRLTGEEVGLSVDSESIVKAMHKDLDSWRWPQHLLESSHDETKQLVVSYNREAYEPGLRAELDKYNETARDPVNATIVFDEAAQKFVVQPEQEGTKLNVDAVLASTAEAIGELDSKVSIGDEHLIKPTVYSTDEKLIQAAELASGMVSANLSLIMGGQHVGDVSGSQLSEFVTVNENFEVTFREEDMDAWVNDLAMSFDTVGTERVYTRPDGKVIAVSGGVYGWEVDSAALKDAILEGVRSGAVTELEVPCLETAAVYNGPNQPDWGLRYIDVDISEQYVRYYGDDGEIIWEAPCISGAPDGEHDTGRGVWRVNGKESPSKLIGYEHGKKIYETSVTYWMPFEGNGIGFHDATWQPSFGGSMYANGYGSHGCVNLSYSDAESLYGIIQYGDCVIVHG